MLPNHLNNRNLKFRHSWRPEQQRVLDNVLAYLDDKRIHIVAAPGAGKTVIGIEIFNRLGLKTLVVSPTRLIRNQWLDRITDFLPTDEIPQWCSNKLSECRGFTATTYQGLFSLDKQISQNDEQAQFQCISQWFAKQQFELLILDEAHHLKAAWQKVLMKFINSNKNLIVISLTATPPYDATPQEWSRYQKLCGPVDEQISIPELVRSNSLCPHQDYIWMVKTDEKNVTSLIRHQQNLEKFIKSLENHAELNYLISTHQWLDENQEIKVNDLFYDLDECFALMSLLKQRQRTIPLRLLTILEINSDDIPPMSVANWEILLQSFIDGGHYPQAQVIQSFQEALSTLLTSKRFLRKKRVTLDSTKRKLEAFNKTQERIKACFDISQLEYKARKKWMRLVILSDFIRDEKYQLNLNGLEAPTGAYPIFHYFIHHFDNEIRLKTVLLTGRLAIIPKELIAAVADLLPNNKTVDYQDYSENKDFVVVTNKTDELSAAFTELHQQGQILVIIGTRSLLGEGWDAPHVNALIMATQTGAYVTTNQIRGRAIRIDTADDMKSASIWHIIAVAEQSSYNAYIFQDLHRRFKTFAGIHASELKIESGIQRLALIEEINPQQNLLNHSNTTMEKRLNHDIFNLQARWQNALEKVIHHRLKTGIQLDYSKTKNNNLSRYVAQLSNKASKKYRRFKKLSWTSALLAPVAIIITGLSQLVPILSFTGALTASSLAISHWRHTRAQIGMNPKLYSKRFAYCVLEALHQLGLMQTANQSEDRITITEVEDGYYRFSLLNYSHKDNEVFLDALSDLLEPIKRPRYMVALSKNPTINNIFPVPNAFGVNKKSAQIFLKHWQTQLPEFKQSTLIASSSDSGKRLLLKLLAKTYRQKHEEQAEPIRFIERWE